MRLLKILNFRFFSKFFLKIIEIFQCLRSPSFFYILQQTGFSKNPKSPPFSILKNFALFEPWIWRRLWTFPSCYIWKQDIIQQDAR